jgi:hypothetical protein
MKTANRTLLAVLFVFLVTGLAFGQGMKLPRAIPQDAQLVARDGDITYYSIPEESEASNALWEDAQSAGARGDRNYADPVWMFDVLLSIAEGPFKGSTVFSIETGEMVTHDLQFCLASDATVVTKWVVRGGPEAWTRTSNPTFLPKNCYWVTSAIKKSKTYKKPGQYLFKGFALANGMKPSAYNTDTFKFWVTQ